MRFFRRRRFRKAARADLRARVSVARRECMTEEEHHAIVTAALFWTTRRPWRYLPRPLARTAYRIFGLRFTQRWMKEAADASG